ncbi:MAG TPA: hypothetical protein GXX33_00475 [Firmicutes bacterium]|uniref:Uncharacterized protein n=1 Tax=Capillibacterium thermochitinicola TaxID=2699427 RepID=A0A8J6LHE3_9FIRM|nr:hypothetical protein [Capillibacterium thermochitinicola]MBA2132005.1 hypothetical protein [Capillibacterium thermochitinicola]HHW11465.1 hypothetical protein [Bacillota bacterium]
MKKLWLFPMIFFLLILLAGYLRWEKGPLQQVGAYQVQHLKDQWTGQRWVILYGGLAEESSDPDHRPYPLYSGEWLPYFSREELDLRLEEVLNRPEYQGKRQILQQRIKDLEIEAARVAESTDKAPAVTETERETVRQALYDATWELNTLYAGAKQVLLAEYRGEAKKRELLATAIWGFLLVVTFSFALHYFLAEVKRWKQVHETYEIVEYVTKNNRYPLGK